MRKSLKVRRPSGSKYGTQGKKGELAHVIRQLVISHKIAPSFWLSPACLCILSSPLQKNTQQGRLGTFIAGLEFFKLACIFEIYVWFSFV